MSSDKEKRIKAIVRRLRTQVHPDPRGSFWDYHAPKDSEAGRMAIYLWAGGVFWGGQYSPESEETTDIIGPAYGDHSNCVLIGEEDLQILAQKIGGVA